jgi:hypothetical protein
MKKLYSLFYMFFNFGKRIICTIPFPQFNPVQKQTFNSYEEDSILMLCNDGVSIFYNRTYTGKDGENIISTAQEIWFST